MKNTVSGLPPHLLLGIRFTGGTLILSLIFMRRLRGLDWEHVWQGGLAGVLLFCAYCTQTLGLTTTTPGKNAFLTAIYCVIVPFLFWIVNRTRPDKYNIAAAVVCIAGIGFVSLEPGFVVGRGDLLTLVGGFFYAAHIVAVAKIGRDKDPILLTIMQFAVSAVLAWTVWGIFESRSTDYSVLASREMLFNLAYLVLGATSIGMLLQNIGQKYTNPSSAALILSLESVFGVVSSVIFYHEELTARLIIGFALIFAAIIISETKLDFLKKRTPPEQLQADDSR